MMPHDKSGNVGTRPTRDASIEHRYRLDGLVFAIAIFLEFRPSAMSGFAKVQNLNGTDFEGRWFASTTLPRASSSFRSNSFCRSSAT
jgi:hypothetical protein